MSAVVGGALGKILGASGVMSSPLFRAGMGVLTGGLTPMNLITQGLDLAQGLMGGGLLGGSMGSMLGPTPPGEWDWRNLEQELETVERHAGGLEGGADDPAPAAAGAETLRKAARLGEATLEGETLQTYLLGMEHEGTAVEITLFTRGPGGMPRRMVFASPDLGAEMVMAYSDFDAVAIEFPVCDCPTATPMRT